MSHQTDEGESGSWVKRTHPEYDTWSDDEERMRATLHARRRDLAHYLVPHRFEATETTRKKPEKMDRAELGYGISLNESYLHEIKGHVRSAETRYDWGPLGGDEDTGGAPPENTVARSLWGDATRENTDWTTFFEHDVLTWMLSSPGSLIVPDVPPGRAEAQSDDAGRRPYVRNVPLSRVLDLGRGPNGLRYVKLKEVRDERSPFGENNDFTENVIVYWLADDDSTRARRWDMDGDPMGPEIDMGRIEDRQGDPTIPPVLNTYGRHPDVPWLGSGLLVGLDDIVIDLFNTVNELRTGYRDLVIAFLVFFGDESQAKEMFKALKEGTRFLHGGDGEEGRVERLAAEAAEVDAGIAQVELALKAWAQSAKRKAADAMDRARARSGVSLQAEFQLDLAPLLREVTGRLDNVESEVMHRLAQLDDDGVAGRTLGEVGVSRSDDFRPEEEASRIARLVDEFRAGWDIVPARAKVETVMRWLEASDAVDMEAEVEMSDGGTQPLRELLPDQIEELASLSERNLRQRAELTGTLVRDE